jgi:hypothetical protein
VQGVPHGVARARARSLSWPRSTPVGLDWAVDRSLESGHSGPRGALDASDEPVREYATRRGARSMRHAISLATTLRLTVCLASGIAGLGCTSGSGLRFDAGRADAGCGGAGAAADCGEEASAGYYDAGNEPTAEEPDSAADTSILGNCTTADDCVAVLDYRNGFECWFPSAASRTDVSRDPCLIPWTPEPECTTAAPPPECPSGPQPVAHSCLLAQCMISVCNEGKCSIHLPFECDRADAGAGNCDALRAIYLNALASAQRCYPPLDPTGCWRHGPDACGCDVPYDGSGVCGDAALSALADLQNANCPITSCGNTCAAPTAAGATCVPNASGTAGTCAWK